MFSTQFVVVGEQNIPHMGNMCNLSWTPHSSIEKDNALNVLALVDSMGCLEYKTKN